MNETSEDTYAVVEADSAWGTLRTARLQVEYTTCRAPSGEWYALGTVHSTPRPAGPAWLLVGEGTSLGSAIDGLRSNIMHAERRLIA